MARLRNAGCTLQMELVKSMIWQFAGIYIYTSTGTEHCKKKLDGTGNILSEMNLMQKTAT